MEELVSLLGLVTFIAIAWLASTNRRAVRWRTVLWGLGLQMSFAVVILKTKLGFVAFHWLSHVVQRFLDFSDAGAAFVFGDKFTEHLFAFKVLPTIIFFSSFITVLYYFGIIQKLVEGVAWVMMKTMGTSGSESLSAAANIFVGQTEAPLLVKPYVGRMTLSELHAVMTGGFATIAGGVLAAYVSFGVPAGHLIAASVMSAPAALVMSKIMFPETATSLTAGHVRLEVERPWVNAVDAAASGATDGMKLVLNVAAMLIGFLALVALTNAILGWAGGLVGLPQLSLEWLFSYAFAPIAWLMGVPWHDAGAVGVLLGKKTVLNEFIAYLDLKNLIVAHKLSERAVVISTYALCGFSNIGSIGIQIGGIGGIAPERKHDLARLGVRAMIAGTLACFMTATIAGMLL